MDVRKILNVWNQYRSIFIMIVFIMVVGGINPRFLRITNIMNILNQTSYNAVLAAGLTTVILTGGIDISVGSVLAFSGASAALLLARGHSVPTALLAAFAVGLLAGIANGVFIAHWKLQPMIVTLATMSILRGATYLLTNGSPINVASGAFKFIGGGRFGGIIPTPIFIMLAIFALLYYVLNRTPFGRWVYAVGGNADAAYLSGINTKGTKIAAYAISGLLAAVAGIIVTARLSSAQPLAGQYYEMDAIAAAVIGGASLQGGQGRILFSIVGALIIGMLNNSLNLMNVSSYYQTVIKGVVILIAVLIDAKSK
jgi:ribose transport system permease protein